MSNLRYIKTDKQYKREVIVNITEPMDGRKGAITRKYKVIHSGKMFSDDDKYFYTILEEIKGTIQ